MQIPLPRQERLQKWSLFDLTPNRFVNPVHQTHVTYARLICPALRDSTAIHFINLSRKVDIMLFAPKETGQGLIEYALILSLVALVVFIVIKLTGPRVGNTYSSINNSVP